MSITRSDPKFARQYERATLRSAFVSLFWAVFSHRKKRDGLTLQALAKEIPANKAEVSRWFKGDPNWTINTIASLANALNVDVRVQAIDRKTGEVWTPAGLQSPVQTVTRQHIPSPAMEAEPTAANPSVSRVLRGPPVPVETSSAEAA
jgi:transcriptional regulator with XRE-family HTH domain